MTVVMIFGTIVVFSGVQEVNEVYKNRPKKKKKHFKKLTSMKKFLKHFKIMTLPEEMYFKKIKVDN